MSLFSNFKRKKSKNIRTLKKPYDTSLAVINKKDLKKIMISLPRNLSYLFIMYYFYMEVGIIANQSYRYKYINNKNLQKMSTDYSLVSLSKLYISLLKKANLKFTYNIVKEEIKQFVPYTYTFITIENQTLALLLQYDLDLIKKSRRTKKFAGYANSFYYVCVEEKTARQSSIAELEKTYGPFYQVPRDKIRRMEKHLGYAYFGNVDFKKEVKIDEIMDMIRHDLTHTSLYRNYILAGRILEPHAEIRYALGFLFKHVDAMESMLELTPLEKLEYYKRYIYEILSPKDLDRITIYDIYYGNFCDTFACILRVNNEIYDDELERPHTFYIFSKTSEHFLKQKPRDLYCFQALMKKVKHRIIEYKNPRKKVTLTDIDFLHGIQIK